MSWISSLSSRIRYSRRSSGPSKTSRRTAIPVPASGVSDPKRFPDLLHLPFRDRARPLRPLGKDLPHRDTAFHDPFPPLADGREHLLHVPVHPLLALDAPDPRRAATHVDLPDGLLVGKDLVVGEDVADLRVARIDAAHPRRVGDHRLHLRPDLIGRIGQKDRVAVALAHLAVVGP